MVVLGRTAHDGRLDKTSLALAAAAAPPMSSADRDRTDESFIFEVGCCAGNRTTLWFSARSSTGKRHIYQSHNRATETSWPVRGKY